MARFHRVLLRMAPSQNSIGYIYSLVSFVRSTWIVLQTAQQFIFSSDIAFYGINLNQTVVLTDIGFGSGATPYITLHNLAIGNIIVSAAVSHPHAPSYIYISLHPRVPSQALMLQSPSPISSAVYASNSSASLSSQSSTPSGPVSLSIPPPVD